MEPLCFIQPAYGVKGCLVNWTVPVGWEDAAWYVYRSISGMTEWVCLNPDDPVVGQAVWMDPNLNRSDRIEIVYYRVVAERTPVGGELERIRSAPAGTFDQLTRREYNLVRKIMRDEVRWMRTGNGIKVLHLIPLREGAPNPAYDPDTNQQTGACTADTGYGQPKDGGFGDPRQTWIALESRGPEVKKDQPDGTGTTEQIVVQARMLAFPQPRRGHLLIHPPTDDRYVVADTVEPYRFRGIIPVAYRASLTLLRRNDARYRIPIPTLEPDPTPI